MSDKLTGLADASPLAARLFAKRGAHTGHEENLSVRTAGQSVTYETKQTTNEKKLHKRVHREPKRDSDARAREKRRTDLKWPSSPELDWRLCCDWLAKEP